MKTRMVLLATLALTIAPTFAQQQADDPVRWYRLAAEQGHVDAQFSLGMRYLEGRDVQVDLGEARKWLEAAAMQGHAEAQFQLANLLSGDSAPASPPKPTIAPALPPPKIVSPPVAKPETSPTIAPAPAPQPAPATLPISIIAQADLKQCAFADPPTVIDGQWARRRDMRKLDEEIRTYASAMQASLTCIDRLGERQLTDADKQTLDSYYNNGVDQLTFIVDQYNRQVREFRISERIPDPLDTAQ